MKNFNNISAVLISAAAISLMGCASGYKQESTGEYIDSSVITTKVKSALLADDKVHSLPITVKTYKNAVQLSGFVNTYSEKVRAEKIAYGVPGVQSVEDSLVVK